MDKLEKSIRAEVPYIGIKPYSHNIIGLILSQIDKEFGFEKVKEIVIKYHLADKGWGYIVNDKKNADSSDDE